MKHGDKEQNAAPTPAVESDATFGAKVRSAVFWRSGSQILAQIITWGSTLAVIRILDPSDYGLFAMTQTVMVFLAFLNGYWFAGSLIQSHTVTQKEVRQAFGLLILLNFALALVQIVGAPLVAAYYRQPFITDMLRVQALIYLATPFMVVPEVLMSRQLDFRRQAFANLAAAIAGAATALACALSGWGVWTLVAAPIALFWTRAAGLMLAAKLWVWPSFDFRGTRKMLGFGSTLLASHFFWIIHSQSDIFIAGRLLDPHALGLYAEALFLAQVFAAKFVPPLNEVAFPAYARLQQEPAKLSWAFLKSMRLILMISCPLYLGLCVTAEPLVYILFGEKWLGMVPFIQLLSLAMPFMTFQILFAPATNALGAPNITLRASIFGAVIMPSAFAIGIQFGAIGLAAAWLIAFPIFALFTCWQAQSLIGFTLHGLLQALWPGLSASIAMAALVYLVNHFILVGLANSGIDMLARLVVMVASGGTAYVLLLRILAPTSLSEMIRLVIRRRAPEAVEAMAEKRSEKNGEHNVSPQHARS
ncbi:MAG: lipopolysaccharide biosynthesis protein [Pseudomonadota bacterium]